MLFLLIGKFSDRQTTMAFSMTTSEAWKDCPQGSVFEVLQWGKESHPAYLCRTHHNGTHPCCQAQPLDRQEKGHPAVEVDRRWWIAVGIPMDQETKDLGIRRSSAVPGLAKCICKARWLKEC